MAEVEHDGTRVAAGSVAEPGGAKGVEAADPEQGHDRPLWPRQARHVARQQARHGTASPRNTVTAMITKRGRVAIARRPTDRTATRNLARPACTSPGIPTPVLSVADQR